MIDPKFNSLVAVRGKLMTLKVMSRISGKRLLTDQHEKVLDQINILLAHNLTTQDFNNVQAMDLQRERSTAGMLKSGKIKALPSLTIDQKIADAFRYMPKSAVTS